MHTNFLSVSNKHMYFIRYFPFRDGMGTFQLETRGNMTLPREYFQTLVCKPKDNCPPGHLSLSLTSHTGASGVLIASEASITQAVDVPVVSLPEVLIDYASDLTPFKVGVFWTQRYVDLNEVMKVALVSVLVLCMLAPFIVSLARCVKLLLTPKKYSSVCAVVDEENTGKLLNANCTICMEDFSAKEKVAKMRVCEHVFHRECIDPWLEKNNRCPNCQQEIQ